MFAAVLGFGAYIEASEGGGGGLVHHGFCFPGHAAFADSGVGDGRALAFRVVVEVVSAVAALRVGTGRELILGV